MCDVCSFCAEPRPCTPISGTELAYCTECGEELAAWAAEHTAAAIEHQDAAALPWELAWSPDHDATPAAVA